mgnify:CR=1 FL=1
MVIRNGFGSGHGEGFIRFTRCYEIEDEDWEALRHQGDPLWKQMIRNRMDLFASGAKGRKLDEDWSECIDRLVSGMWYIREGSQYGKNYSTIYFEKEQDMVAVKLTLNEE